MQPQALPGFRDVYPDDAALRNQIFGAWRAVAARYGFVEYDGPPLEPLELYTGKSGDEIVAQLYAFEDKGGRQVALRPEMTPTLGRMIGARVQALKKPVRWFSIPQLFRYERQQRGRLREHFQLNLDIIGEPGPLADAELIAAAVDVLRALGLGSADVQARISDRRILRRLLEVRGLTAQQVGVAYAHIDKLGREPRARLVRALAATARLSPETAEEVLRVGGLQGLAAVREATAGLPANGSVTDDLAACVEALAAMGLAEFVEVDLSVVRGLAYYTGIVFELFDRDRTRRAICGGGRYDGLLGMLGDADLPAVGFGMGDVVLGDLLHARGLAAAAAAGLDVFLVAVTGDDVPHVLHWAHELRDAGLRVEYALKPQSVAKQLRLAGARPAAHAVILGPAERGADAAVVRDLGSGQEERVALEGLVEHLRGSGRHRSADRRT